VRITTRLRIISVLAVAALVAMLAAVAGSMAEARRIREAFALANDLKVALAEGNAFRDQYFLGRSEGSGSGSPPGTAPRPCLNRPDGSWGRREMPGGSRRCG
jgi:hypothetical protein